MAASCPLPDTPDLPTLRAKLQGLLQFLREALPISSAHTVDFYTESMWDQLIDLSPETVLATLRRTTAEVRPSEARPLVEAERESGISDFCKIFCETSQKLVNVEVFALAAQYYSLQNLGICTPFEQLLTVLQRKQNQRIGEDVKPEHFMNMKKSHEVHIMSELINSIADFCGVQQVIDLGSGKGYLSSFLSLKYGFSVYGIDSSDVNTRGAKERNRKLTRQWRLYHTRSRSDVSGLAFKMTKERKVQNEIEHKANIEEEYNKNALNQEEMSPPGILPDFSDPVISKIKKQMANPHAQQPQEENLCFENVFPFIDVLPIEPVEPTSSSGIANRGISDAKKERRKASSKSSESNIYSPLTSFITADSELCDIINDLEDCLMVGLHTCGDLAANTLRIFTSKNEIKGVCSVGCCYHLLSEEFEKQLRECTQEKWGFPMCQYLKEERWCCGRNARMSACLLPTESLFYRAVLQDIIKDCFGITKCDQHVGKIYSKSSSFLDYVRKFLAKLGLDEHKVSEKIIMDYYEKYKLRVSELEAFNMLKVVLAPCIETLILLDRLCYLKEQEDIAWCSLVKLFDPVTSPRCYAIIALKKQQ
ncbi:probable methyltransferase-like protein 25 isoform X2 [Echinops telfairi]|uniref:Probable methyltransferase-like protein 25 isoform X2 n=1 Tax=Echinops telfairi TaxID=9371 RepID=A0AC55D404_ECHTE|nr:probable methyltransferase-like protein 25 isoform X2 [Echinops telfairi]